MATITKIRQEARAELLERLCELERKLGDSRAGFAQRLGIPPPTWASTRSGRKPLGVRVASAVVQHLDDPELRELALEVLALGHPGAGLQSGPRIRRKRMETSADTVVS